ncbi:MAG: DUF2510 domain-containing protein [Actinomycetota bacterium]
MAGLPGGIIVSLTLQSDTELPIADPSRRAHRESEAPPLRAGRTETAGTSGTITPGWYADPLGSPRSRWWDGHTWTAELGAEAPSQPASAPEFAMEARVQGPLAGHGVAAAPLSRRQLRELVGPLTTGPELVGTVLVGIAAEEPGAPVPVAVESTVRAEPAVEEIPAPEDTDSPSPFETLFASSAAEGESAEAAPLADPTAFVDPTNFLDPTALAPSSVARPWIGEAAPLVPAASVPTPMPVQPAPPGASTTGVAPAAPSFRPGVLGFSLPPDPFATPAAAVQATPPTFVPVPSVAVSPSPRRTARSTTAAVWFLAVLPAAHAALVWLLLGQLDLGRLDLGGYPVIRYSVLGAPLVLSLVFAFADRRVLGARGFQRTAPAILGFVPFVYLLVRAIRVGPAGIAPLLTWLLLQAAAFSFILVQVPVVFALVPLAAPAGSAHLAVASGPITAAQRSAELTPSGMAAELTRQTLTKNLRFASITCPPIPVTVDGTTVSCVGTLASVKTTLNVVIDSSLPNSAFALVSEAPAA